MAQTVSVTGVTASTPVVVVDVQLGSDADTNADLLAAWALVSGAKDPVQGAGTLTFYATEAPAVALTVKVGIC